MEKPFDNCNTVTSVTVKLCLFSILKKKKISCERFVDRNCRVVPLQCQMRDDICAPT